MLLLAFFSCLSFLRSIFTIKCPISKLNYIFFVSFKNVDTNIKRSRLVSHSHFMRKIQKKDNTRHTRVRAHTHTHTHTQHSVLRVDPGFLEVGFRCVKEGIRFADFISFFLNIPLTETKLFHFEHGILSKPNLFTMDI